MIENAKFAGYYFDINLNIWADFQICINVPLTNLSYIRCNILQQPGLP